MAVVISLGAFLVATSAFYPLDSLSVFDAKRVLQLVLFVSVLIFACSWAPLRNATVTQLTRLSKSTVLILGLFFLIGILSSLRLDHPGYALIDVSMLFVMMLLIFVTAGSRELTGKIFDKIAVLSLIVLGFAVAFQELTGFISGWVLGIEFNYDLALVHFAHPRFYNQLQTWSMPLIAALPLFFPGKPGIKWMCITLLGLQWFLVISLSARGTFVSLLIAMTFIAFWLPRERKFWMKYQFMGILAGIFIYSGALFLNSFFIPQAQTGEFYAHSMGRSIAHTSGRSVLWRLSVEDAIDSPWLGAGPTQYACDGPGWLPAHPHSFPFRIVGEWGFIAVGLLFYLATAIGIKFLIAFKRQNKGCHGDSTKNHLYDCPLRALLATSVIAGSIHACLSGLLIMPASQVAMVMMIGWALGMTHNSGQIRTRSVVAGFLLVFGLLLNSAQLVFALKEIPQLPTRTGHTEGAGPLFPRFWWTGKTCDYLFADD